MSSEGIDPAAEQWGTLALVTVPAGADTGGTSATGGAAGTGLLEVSGLALALAAQDSLKNILGSMMIMLDKPCRVGERSGDRRDPDP